MLLPELVIRARRVVTEDGVRPATVTVAGGLITDVGPYESAPGQLGGRAGVADLADDEVLLPGLVDIHVHVNEPGRTSWEGFNTATKAAAAGGITTIIDMPLNSVPPTTDAEALRAKQAAARGQCHVDVGFWGGAVPDNGRPARSCASQASSALSASRLTRACRSSRRSTTRNSSERRSRSPGSAACCLCTPRMPP